MGLGYESVLAPSGFIATADGTALANSNTITDVSPAPQIVVPANAMSPGDAIRVWGTGKLSTSGTPTLILGFYWGAVAGTKLAATTTMTTTTASTNWPFHIEGLIICRSNGATGTMATCGRVFLPTSLTQFQAAYPLDASAFAAVTVDTTTSKVLSLGATWGTATTPNTLTVNQWVVEALNF